MSKGHLVAAVIVTALAAAACGGGTEPSENTDAVSGLTNLQVTDVSVGAGAEATAGRLVTVHYTGWLYSRNATDHRGAQFDSSRNRQPFQFQLGVSSVIAGWHQGVSGMKVGGQRTLTIPPALGYGSSGQGSIPPNATLVFDIELLNVN
jgi:FKBP-type peptidyl-prolyl cis-trans isomerase